MRGQSRLLGRHPLVDGVAPGRHVIFILYLNTCLMCPFSKCTVGRSSHQISTSHFRDAHRPSTALLAAQTDCFVHRMLLDGSPGTHGHFTPSLTFQPPPIAVCPAQLPQRSSIVETGHKFHCGPCKHANETTTDSPACRLTTCGRTGHQSRQVIAQSPYLPHGTAATLHAPPNWAAVESRL